MSISAILPTYYRHNPYSLTHASVPVAAPVTQLFGFEGCDLRLHGCHLRQHLCLLVAEGLDGDDDGVEVGLCAVQLRHELADLAVSTFTSLACIPATPTAPGWSGGSVSVVRLQCILRELRPMLYAAVVDVEFRGTFQKFLTDATRLSLFFYDATDFAVHPLLGQLFSKHEERCAACWKGDALAKDLMVAEHWAMRFVPLELTGVALRVAYEVRRTSPPVSPSTSFVTDSPGHPDSGSASLDGSFVGGGGSGAWSTQQRTYHMRQLVDMVAAAAEGELVFAKFISKNRLKDAARDALRRTMPLVCNLQVPTTPFFPSGSG